MADLITYERVYPGTNYDYCVECRNDLYRIYYKPKSSEEWYGGRQIYANRKSACSAARRMAMEG